MDQKMMPWRRSGAPHERYPSLRPKANRQEHEERQGKEPESSQTWESKQHYRYRNLNTLRFWSWSSGFEAYQGCLLGGLGVLGGLLLQ
jgi:hypothetical protein